MKNIFKNLPWDCYLCNIFGLILFSLMMDNEKLPQVAHLLGGIGVWVLVHACIERNK